MSLQDSCIKALILSMIVFGDGISKEVIKAKLNHKGWALIHRINPI